MRLASGADQARAKGDEDVDRDLIVIEGSHGRRHRFETVKLIAFGLGDGPVEELITGHGGDADWAAHSGRIGRRGGGLSCGFGLGWLCISALTPALSRGEREKKRLALVA